MRLIKLNQEGLLQLQLGLTVWYMMVKSTPLYNDFAARRSRKDNIGLPKGAKRKCKIASVKVKE